jgi:uncharacterized protein
MITKLQDDLKIAMREANKVKINAIRNVLGKIKAKQIDKRALLTEEEIIKVLLSNAKQIKESIDQFRKAGREDLLAKELAELTVVEVYLPQQMSVEEIKVVILNKITEMDAKSMADMGKVMGASMKEFSGKADGKMVQKIVRECLS